ncbi:hypothetical protein SO802_030704 [Lithocarpus litseifolius]|uniref:Transposase n=1 Tax=Lithocarpus litseifolius TaxID=425828 RepID=A0AAW2BK05_9ROSI
MEPSSVASPSQTTPATQAEPAAQAELAATLTNAETFPLKPNGKAKVSEIAADCGNNRKKSTTWDHFEKNKDHRGETIGRKIEMYLHEWSVDGIFTLTVDNASSNGATIKFLQTLTKDWKGTVLEHEFLHIRCCAHILNLIMGDGLKKIDASIARVREAMRYVKSSPNRNQTFRSFMERLGIESKCLLSLNVPTTWNSTYLPYVRYC